MIVLKIVSYGLGCILAAVKLRKEVKGGKPDGKA